MKVAGPREESDLMRRKADPLGVAIGRFVAHAELHFVNLFISPDLHKFMQNLVANFHTFIY
jgi:hypothetical protein